MIRGYRVAALLVALFISSIAWAQQRRPRAGRTITLDVTRIEGRIQKPQAFYILQRSNLNFEGLELKRSFVPKSIESVEKEPF